MIPTAGSYPPLYTSYTLHGTTYDFKSPTTPESPSTHESPITRESLSTHESPVTNGEATNQRNKMFVEPDCDFRFLLSKPTVDVITKVIRSQYNYPWNSWGEIPKDTKEM